MRKKKKRERVSLNKDNLKKFGVRKPGFWLEPSQMLTMSSSCNLSGPSPWSFKIEGVALNQSRETGGRCRLFILQGFYILISYQHFKIGRFYRKAQISASSSWRILSVYPLPLLNGTRHVVPTASTMPASRPDTEAAYQLLFVIYTACFTSKLPSRSPLGNWI